MYAPANYKLHHFGAPTVRAWERTTYSPERFPAASRLWWQFHITKWGLREMKFTAPAGGLRSAYKERLAIMASPIVAFADDFVDR